METRCGTCALVAEVILGIAALVALLIMLANPAPAIAQSQPAQPNASAFTGDWEATLGRQHATLSKHERMAGNFGCKV